MLSPSRIFVLGVLTVLAVSTIALSGIYWNIYGYAKMFNDFHTFHATSQNVIAHKISAIYDIENLRKLISSGTLKEFAYFLNPPTTLLLIYPLGLLSALPALLFWTVSQLVLLYCVIRTDYMQRLFAPIAERAVNTEVLLVIAFLAFSLQNILFGQVAGFCTVLFLLVVAWRKTHPVWAGIMLGIFSFKPQLGILLPLLLLAEGNWKALFWAVITTLLMVLLSLQFWGVNLWQDFGAMMEIRTQFLAQKPDLLFTLCISFFPAIRNLGVPPDTAILCQGALSILILLALWPVLRRGSETQKLLMLCFAAYLVTPYALIYDTPLLAIPCAWLLRRAEENRVKIPELIVLLLLALFPLVALMLQIDHIPYSVIAIGAGLIVARMLEKPLPTVTDR